MLPGVRSAAFADGGVMRGTGFQTTVAPQGVLLPRKAYLNTSVDAVTEGYFDAMGIALRAGQVPGIRDARTRPTPIVVNQQFAAFFFPKENPIGKLIVFGMNGNNPPDCVIVGIVATAKYRSMREDAPPMLYRVMDESHGSERPLLLYVRTRDNPARIADAVRKVLVELDPLVPLADVSTLDQEIRATLWQERLVALLSGFFACVSLVLVGLALSSSVAYSIAQRMHELSIRIAVGGQVRHIVKAVCAPIARALGLGLAIGLLATVFLVRLTRRLLFGVEPLDPLSFAVAVALVVSCSVLIVALATWRVSNINLAAALREE